MPHSNDQFSLLERVLGPIDFRDSRAREILELLEDKDLEIIRLKESRANLAVILEELKEQIKLLTDERDSLIESMQRLQGEFFVYPPNVKKVFDIDAQLSPVALKVFRAMSKHVDQHHTFVSLRQETLLEDFDLLEAVMELYRGELVEISDDREHLEALHLSHHGRERLSSAYLEHQA